jgi:hypothetical protein
VFSNILSLCSLLFVSDQVSNAHKTTGKIHSVFCLTTGPKPLPKLFLHIVRSRASSFK